MKNVIIFLLICFIGFFNSFAQEEENSTYSSEIFQTEQEGLNILSNFSNQSQADEIVYGFDNSIIIQQVGFNNNVISNTKSQSSEIELIQNGNFNDIYLSIDAPRIDATIIQNGDNNSAVDNIYYTNSNVSLHLTQNGDNLTFNRIGVNSLTSKIKFVQEGSFKTITVISN